VDTHAADRGYDDGKNHYGLKNLRMHSAILLNRYHTEKKDRNKQVWIDLKKISQYQVEKRQRYKIEREFGDAKANNGLRTFRDVGRMRYAIQA
jgi:hypothetical protein